MYLLSKKEDETEIVLGFPSKVSLKLEYEAETIGQHIEAFRMFLLACGYSEKLVCDRLGEI